MSKNIQKVWRKVATASLFALALIISPLSGASLVSAAAGEAIWTGAAGDSKFSSAGNWEGNTLPTAGDVLVFNTAPVIPQGQYQQNLDNDINVAFGGVKSELQGWASSDGYSLQKPLRLIGNPILLRNGPAVYTYLAGTIIEGDITLTQSNQNVLTLSEVQGTLTLVSGANAVVWRGDGGIKAQAYIIQNGAEAFCTAPMNGSQRVTAPVTLGGGSGALPKVSPSCGGPGSPEAGVLTFANVTLLSDAEMGVAAPHSIVVEQLNKNGHSLTRTQGATGVLTLPGGEVIENTVKDVAIDGDDPTSSVTLVDKETGILNGNRRYVTVGTGATMKGQGVLRELYVSPQGVVSPGNSPGSITVLLYLSLGVGSVYNAELINVDSYDQLVVGEEYEGNTSAVNIGGATLNTVLLEGWKINQGDSFTIIDNKSEAQVSGTFDGLDEGTQFIVDGITFSISYVGGDGNDVVITALNEGTDPNAPNTGAAQIVLANPAILAGLGIVTAGFLVYLASRRKSAN